MYHNIENFKLEYFRKNPNYYDNFRDKLVL